ncbi:MAG TPA: Rrf2 family transcriptional regulator [Candidatus Polarisedimenticolaceae bacterium]|nr:Rrf2 family transcriptional regulator [Candidatus Polarisedimenticolaceae bacterium]
MLTLSKSTRYALYATMEMARAAGDGHVTAAEVAGRYKIPPSVLAKVFQQLVRSGLARGSRGSGGGYRLARAAGEITVLEVMRAFQPPNGAVPSAAGEPAAAAPLTRLLDEVAELARCTFASVTLETLTRTARPVHRVPSAGR